MNEHRILSLLPSTTEIVGALGLADHLVGVTHECDVCPDPEGLATVLARGVPRVTGTRLFVESPPAGADGSSPLGQAEIDAAVRASLAEGASLYTLDAAALRTARPTVVLTQALCSVCAPSAEEVESVCRSLADSLGYEGGAPTIVSLEPNNVAEVAASLETVGAACGVPERGYAARDRLLHGFAALAQAVEGSAEPSLLFLEWLDPPFVGGHWVPEQVTAAGARPAWQLEGHKSTTITWDAIEAADPDTLVVGCCGFDLERNVRDVRSLLGDAASEAGRRFRGLRAVREGRLYALDGNRYFARPSPAILQGAAILARIAHAREPQVLERLRGLNLAPEGGWAPVQAAAVAAPPPAEPSSSVWALHDAACEAGALQYTDPATGFRVFTRLGLERRGRCCGCGCRHCPYGHAAVQDRAGRIQQPALLHRSTHAAGPSTVLFWSGGKDSLLALRALLRAPERPSRVVLLTTFDAATRTVAHQEVPIHAVVRQAAWLDLDLVGVPLHPGAPYLRRVMDGLAILRSEGLAPDALAFGDLHLEHIRAWRDEELATTGLRLLYPIWQVPYADLLDDLEASGVPCRLSAVAGRPDVTPTAPVPEAGALFTRALANDVARAGWDAFGEVGEFHTLAEVWAAPRDQVVPGSGIR